MRIRTVLVVGIVTASVALTGCGSKKKAVDTTVAAAAAETTAAPVETTAAPAETTAAPAETTAAAPADTTAAAATETTASAAPAGGATDALAATFIGEMLKGMSGTAEADPKDVECITSKVKSEDLAGLVSAAGAGGAGDSSAGGMKAVMKAVFSCKPKGLMDSFAKDTFETVGTKISDDEKSCLANKMLDIVASDDAILDAAITGGEKMPAGLKAKAEGIVKDCVKDAAAQKALIADLNKQ